MSAWERLKLRLWPPSRLERAHADNRALTVALLQLVAAKDLKDAQGRTPEYVRAQHRAWAFARSVLARRR